MMADALKDDTAAETSPSADPFTQEPELPDRSKNHSNKRLRETISSESELEHLQRQRVTVIIPVLVLVVNGPEDHHRSVNQRGSVGQFLNIWQKALELLQVLQIKDRQEETEPVSGHQD